MKGRVALILGCFSLWLCPQLPAAESGLRNAVRSATEKLRTQAGIIPVGQGAANGEQDSEKTIPVYVVLRGEPAVRTVLEARTSAFRRSTTSAKQRISQIRAQQESLLTRLRFLGARHSFSYQRLANAIQVRLPVSSLPELRSMPEVLRIDPVTLHEIALDSSVPYTGAPVVWGSGDFSRDGSGITIGVIDTGIDYTHANLGGSGLVEDFEGNDPDVIEPGTFPNAKVVGGHDFAGNSYDASSSDPGINTPLPDSDPLDCNGHGTHVSGSAAGQGVLAGDGFGGPYTEDLDLGQFDVAPGVAPGAELHALKVFGCRGASLLVMAALEYAVDPNGDGDFSDRLDVVNLSVGVAFANGIDSSETEVGIIKNLADMGTSVVAAAGNNGNTFYAVAAPGMAPSAISVAALDDAGVVPESITLSQPNLADLIRDFSSRGPSVRGNVLKPELSAPGFDVLSSLAGTGTDGIARKGTSFSSPHVAGMAALLRQTHPNWTAQEIKAALMNTADVMIDAGGNKYPESLAGAGRARVDRAAQTSVTISSQDSEGEVSLSLGSLKLSHVYSKDHTIVLTNHGSQAKTFSIEVEETVGEVGASLSPLQETVLVPGNASATTVLRFQADPLQFDRTTDPTTPLTQQNESRHTLFEISGKIRFDDGVLVLRLPYYGVINAASAMHADAAHLGLPRSPLNSLSRSRQSDRISVSIPMSGESAHPQPLVSVFEVGLESPASESSDFLEAAADILWVGVTTDLHSVQAFSESHLYFGLATREEWTTSNSLEIEILIDTDQDGSDDYRVLASNSGTARGSLDTDTFITTVTDLETSQRARDSLINIVPPDLADTALFNNNVMILPVSYSSLGLSVESASFDYKVRTTVRDSLNDEISGGSFDAANPVIDSASTGLSGFPLHPDGSPIRVNVDLAALAAASASGTPRRLLLLHHHNADSERAEVVSLHLPADLGISRSGGNLQRVLAGSSFSSLLRVKVTEQNGQGVGAVEVTFSAPISGASGTFANGSVVFSTVTAGDGIADSSQFTANLLPGSFQATAAAAGVPGQIEFELANDPATLLFCSGDINGDQTRDILDLILILRDISGKAPLTGQSLFAANLDGDGEIDVLDAVLLLQHLFGTAPLDQCPTGP